MKAKCLVTTDNDIAYLWWSVPDKIPGALGFSIRRERKDGTTKALPAMVGFEKGKPSIGPRDTDVWPIQSFQWKDVFAPRDEKVRYQIYVVKGTAQHPAPEEKPILVTKWVTLKEQFGPFKVVFNRGLLSTQAMNKGSNAPAKNTKLLRKAISTPGDPVRWRLAREVLPTLYELLRRVRKAAGKCYAALYELTDEQLIGELMKTSPVRLVLSNANSSEYDGTNKAVRKQLHDDKYDITDRMLTGNHIGHNKFLVYADATGPSAVLTGSTNWTPTGLCGQTNNAILIENRKVAAAYQEYWSRLQAEKKPLQSAGLRKWTRENPFETSLAGSGAIKVWFSPNTVKSSKTDTEVPVDVKEVFEIIDGAKSMLLFLLFNPGQPSILDQIRKADDAAEQQGKVLYVRGAISDAKAAGQATVGVYSRSAKRANRVITGVAGVPDDFGYWEQELLKLGFAAIHDKILVVDPFSKDCVVVTGSHNLGYKASFGNDENMVIIRGNRPVAEAYATHVLDVVNHYKWRYKLQKAHDEGKLQQAWQDLEEDDKWQDKYFDEKFRAYYDAFILAEAGG